HDAANVVVGRHRVEVGPERHEHRGGQCVELVGAIERERRHAVGVVAQHEFVSHGRNLGADFAAMSVNAVAVYCGSSSGIDERHRATAASLGAALARNGIELVYGGGHVGLMGVLADAALSNGGRVTGVITQSLLYAEVGHRS